MLASSASCIHARIWVGVCLECLIILAKKCLCHLVRNNTQNYSALKMARESLSCVKGKGVAASLGQAAEWCKYLTRRGNIWVLSCRLGESELSNENGLLCLAK